MHCVNVILPCSKAVVDGVVFALPDDVMMLLASSSIRL